MTKPSRKDVASVYAIVGASRYLRDESLRALLASMDPDDLSDVGPSRYDGSAAALADVLDDVRTMSLLGGRRVVVVDEADKFISAHRGTLERYCAEPAGSGTLIFSCNSLPRNTKLYKIIETSGAVIVCEVPKGRALVQWVADRASRTYGKKLSPRAAQMLREQLGDEPGLIDAELSKLSTFVGERPSITEDDVSALTGHLREEKVFAVTDAIASGDTATAMAQWEQVLATDRAAPQRAIAGLAWGVRRLLEARRAYEAGATPFELSRKLFADPDTVRRRMEHVTVSDLENQQRDLLAADLDVKTGASTIELAIEKFIVTHSVRRAAAYA